jgi:hypothetical protein
MTMERYTAQVLIGKCNQCNGGISPEYQIFLAEDNGPVLVLREVQDDREWLWFPGKESIMDDIFLMISTVVFEETEVKAVERLSLLEAYTEKERFDYYEVVRENSRRWDRKVIFNLFHNSTLKNQLEHIKDYWCDMEVTTTHYISESSNNGRNIEKGHL